MIEIQKFILDNGLDALKSKAISAVRSLVNTELVLCKYSMVDSPMADVVVQQARGIILNEADGFNPVCRPFDKFFNHREPLAAKLDPAVRLAHKLDGSLCSLYFFKGSWHVATSGNPDGAGNVDRSGYTFKELFWSTFESQKLMLPTDVTYTYIFELTSPYNRIVVRYDTPKLTLIGVRKTLSGIEEDVELYRHMYPVPEFVKFDGGLGMPLSAIAAAELYVNTRNPVELEGLVAIDKDFKRVKIKSEGYLRLHRIRGNESEPGDMNLLEIVLSGESDEIGAYFTDWKSRMDELKRSISNFKMDIKDTYRTCYRIAYGASTDQATSVTPTAAQQRKEFAAHANKKWHASILFGLLKLQPNETNLTSAIDKAVAEMTPSQKSQFLSHLNDYK